MIAIDSIKILLNNIFAWYIGEYKDMKLDIFEIANMANTNVYDLICRINMRIPRVYIEDEKVVRVVDYLSTEKNYYEL